MSFMKLYALYATHDRAKSLPDYTLALWRTLLFWAANYETVSFHTSSRTLTEDASLSKDMFWQARKMLVDRGYLVVESTRGSHFATYRLCEGKSFQPTEQTDHQVTEKGGGEIEGQIDLSPSGTSVTDSEEVAEQVAGKEAEKAVINQLAHACASDAELSSISYRASLKALNQDQNHPTTTQIGPLVAHAYSVGFNQLSQSMRLGLSDWMEKHTFPDRLAMAKRALDAAGDANCFHWNYVQALLKAWEKKGFTTLQETIDERAAFFKQKQANQKRPRQRRGDQTNESSKEAFFKRYPSADF
ncbi:DnaD/phage-associated family protein [Alkalihalobacillus xiaoxiensis]|uniref:DnaD/phage-associated family protein n=1 Tax=Shouchella xiaoxiensis TaxID=766895 RepID=A0ABS2SQN2_9BACI|nr:DnaD domain protein [Shouchella xiaoxiensis]MBM7837829.1 DnaD/phage-associated family protein [Shouchella xiaoxiensis]